MIESHHISQFESIVCKENCYSDKPHLMAYSYDATKMRFEPDAVLFPRHEQDVSDILKYCDQHRIPVVTRGGGSGYTGGALPSSGGVVLAMEKHMNKILDLDLDNMVAVVQPGIYNRDVQLAAEAKGLFYPPDPASQDYSTIGGNVAENAGGMRAAKYGITKDFVLAMRAVLPGGDIIQAGKKTIKDVAGFNVAGILVGSEGSLAVITEVTLKLMPNPKLSQCALGIFPDIDSAMSVVYKTMAGGVTPVAMEFLDKLTLQAVEKTTPRGMPLEAGALIITEVDGDLPEQITHQIDIIEKIFMENGCMEFRKAKTEEERADIWFSRRNASQSVSVYGNKKINEDVTVPRSKLPDLLGGIQKIGEKYDLLIPCFGHTGDGNVHVNVVVDKHDEAIMEKGYKAIEEIFQLTIDLEGTLSGEHGIGISKAPYMKMAFTDAEMNLFRRIKAAFDPNNILNPGKMGI